MSTSKLTSKLLPAAALALLLTACSTQPETAEKKQPPKPPEPTTGLTAVFHMYQVARTWSPDAQVLKMTSAHLSDIPEVPGKAPAWEATFTSANLGKSRTYTDSIIEDLPSLHKGVFAGLEEAFSGARGENKPFLIIAAKIDTDAAYKTALTKAAAYEKANPGKPITFLLEKITRFPDPTWRVIWGESVGTSNFSIFIDASTGEYLETMH